MLLTVATMSVCLAADPTPTPAPAPTDDGKKSDKGGK
jgi:hypothetical protein